MNTVFCFFQGIGMPEILVLALFSLPVIIVIILVRAFRRKPYIPPPNIKPLDSSPLIRHADRLKVLKELEDKGVISKEEFEAEKKKILAS